MERSAEVLRGRGGDDRWLRHSAVAEVDMPDGRHLVVNMEWTRNLNDHRGTGDMTMSFSGGGLRPGYLDDIEAIRPHVEAAVDEAEAKFARYDDAVTRARSLNLRRPHGRSLPSWWWDEVADIWLGLVEAGLRDPTATFAREAEVPVATVSRWITVCRQQGKLDGAQVDDNDDEGSER